MGSIKTGGLTAALVGIMAHLSFSQAWTNAYTSATATGDCKGLPAGLNTGFSVTPVVSKALFGTVSPYRILKMSFFLQPGATNTDIIMAEKGIGGENARVLWYDGTKASLSVIGTLTNVNYGGGGVEEQGLVGIAVNPKTFTTDNFIYLYYTIGSGNSGSATVGFRITRVTVNSTTKVMDMSSEKTLIHIPAGTQGRWHTGGGMAFDNAGDLYISVSDNEALAMGPGNTADLRGSILRIHPDASNPKGYTIPANNFGAYWAGQFATQGKTGLAAKYNDTTKVKPEIYIKGTRNVYSYSIDRTRPGTVEYSQCGPDKAGERGETHALTTKPTFGGWPFWVYYGGAALRQTAKASAYDEPGEPTDWAAFNPPGMSTSTPVNNWSGNKGVDTLPPYHIPFNSQPAGCAAGGPIIRYDGSITNPGQMPPHLDNVVMFGDYSVSSGTNSIWAMKADASGAVTGTATYVFTMARSGRPSLLNSVDFQQGPDGALYLADFGAPCCSASPPEANGGIVRISYTGNCKDPGLVPVSATPRLKFRGAVDWFQTKSGRLVLNDDPAGLIAKGRHTIKVLDLNGKILYTFEGKGVASYAMPKLAAGQLYVLRAETPVGIAEHTFSQL